MKALLTFCLLVLGAFSSQAQTLLNTTYYDAQWQEIEKIKAVYYSEMYTHSSGKLYVKDYYSDGQVQMEGYFLDSGKKQKEGTFTYYHPNGKISSKGVYKANKRSGTWIWYYSNDAIEEKGNFNKNGLRSGYWEGFYRSEQQKYTGNYKKGQRTGVWNWHHLNGTISAEEVYQNDELIRADYFTLLGAPCKDVESTCGDAQPSFPGGEIALQEYIKKNLNYPLGASKDKAYGTVWVRFTVRVDGEIQDVILSKGSHWALNAEALSIIKSMPKWVPGKKHNCATEFQIELPFYFKP